MKKKILILLAALILLLPACQAAEGEIRSTATEDVLGSGDPVGTETAPSAASSVPGATSNPAGTAASDPEGDPVESLDPSIWMPQDGPPFPMRNTSPKTGNM